jgi:hypothetical protein
MALCENTDEYGMMRMGEKQKASLGTFTWPPCRVTCERLLVRGDHFGIKRDTSPRGKPSEQNYGTDLSPACSLWEAG